MIFKTLRQIGCPALYNLCTKMPNWTGTPCGCPMSSSVAWHLNDLRNASLMTAGRTQDYLLWRDENESAATPPRPSVFVRPLMARATNGVGKSAERKEGRKKGASLLVAKDKRIPPSLPPFSPQSRMTIYSTRFKYFSGE